MRRRTWLPPLAAVVIGVLAWIIAGASDAPEPGARDARGHRRVGSALAGLHDALGAARARRGAIPWRGFTTTADGSVTLAGKVIELGAGTAVGGVDVVFQSDAGEETTTAAADGSYRIDVPAGVYRAFVRDDAVLSVGLADRVRLPGPPSPETANVPDAAMLPLVVATRDADNLDLSVVRAGIIRGRVVDGAGQPIASAVLRATGNRLRPALGTDVAESGADGAFELRVPPGRYVLGAHHARYAGADGAAQLVVEPGEVVTQDLVLAAGCIVSGRVLDARGRPATEGAIERQWGMTDLEFGPAGRIESDGTFVWTTLEEGDVVLRAWPWKSPPAAARRFPCRDGARFDNVVFELPDRAPDIAGVLVDHAGLPVPFAFIDLAPLDPGGIGQQERTDAEGRFGVYAMPTGRYAVTAHAPGRGVVTATVASPQADVRLQLSGTGRIEGTTTLLADGSIELVLGACFDGATVPLPREQRLVAVQNHRFVVEDVPACDLSFVARWREDAQSGRVTVPAGGSARVEVALGPPRPKTVHGVVRDRDGRGVDGAQVTATYGREVATAVTEGGGRYTVAAASGAQIVARAGVGTGAGVAGMANVDAEQVDVVLEPDDVSRP